VAIKAIFIGINKHLDATIPELSGARRDATALWALFTDTVEGLSARLPVDEAATHAEVSGALLGTLAGANRVLGSRSRKSSLCGTHRARYRSHLLLKPSPHGALWAHQPKLAAGLFGDLSTPRLSRVCR
jgi:hypothetical protein